MRRLSRRREERGRGFIFKRLGLEILELERKEKLEKRENRTLERKAHEKGKKMRI